ncbi:MAG: UDP-N-acetylglucosamine 2-epimerase (hydrolyzing), partial [SAR324 cluster bacterium]|nr:UDP-N-acetylglucosamine 2-epimerase (hydrolyzing) [SAR324 cluster bacterium]
SIQDDDKFELQIIATGMHLSPEFGLTFHEIERDGFLIDRKIETLLSADRPSAISKSTGLGVIGFADAFNELVPDILVLLGDRYEILSASIAALFAKIPIAHIHGGETTAGAFDEGIRHSITKMAWWHFVATEEYRKRVIQLGEDPQRVFNVGGIGIDNIIKLNLLDQTTLESELGLKFDKKNLLVTFHSTTLEPGSSVKQMEELLSALDELDDTQLIITMPNADTEGRILFEMNARFVENHPSAKAFTSLGRLNYLSTIQYVDGVIGNSSSGVAEVPSFKKGTINIGDRQRGRIKARSVIDCKPDKSSILQAIEILYTEEFQEDLKTVKNPYGNGSASEKIVEILKNNSIPQYLKKDFYDL